MSFGSERGDEAKELSIGARGLVHNVRVGRSTVLVCEFRIREGGSGYGIVHRGKGFSSESEG